MGFQDGSFDLVIAYLAAHHFHDIAAALREMRRVLRPAGVLVAWDMTTWGHPATTAFKDEVETLRDTAHGTTLMSADWRSLVKDADLRIEEVTQYRRPHDLASWLARADLDVHTSDLLWQKFVGAPAIATRNLDIRIDAVRAAFSDREFLVKARVAPVHAPRPSALAHVAWFGEEWPDWFWSSRRLRDVVVNVPGENPIGAFRAIVFAASGFTQMGDVIVTSWNPCEDRLTVGAQFEVYDVRGPYDDYSAPIGTLEVVHLNPNGAPTILP